MKSLILQGHRWGSSKGDVDVDAAVDVYVEVDVIEVDIYFGCLKEFSKSVQVS